MFAVAALLVGCYGVSLLLEAFNAQGSPEGNALLFTLGLALILSSVIVIVVIVHWKSSPPSRGDKNG